MTVVRTKLRDLYIAFAWTVLFTQTTLVVAQEREGSEECNWETRLKFADDLLCGLRAARCRDPYEERIETERHDFTQSTKTVGHGVVQLEAGYTYFYRDEREEIDNSHATPEMLIRIGLSDDIEFRLRWNFWTYCQATPAGYFARSFKQRSDGTTA